MKILEPFLTTLAGAAVTLAATAQTSPRHLGAAPATLADVKTPAPAGVHPLPIAEPRPAGVAQAPSEERAELHAAPLPIDFSKVCYQDGPDGALWARGETYKMRFDANAATLVPFFSSRSPRNFDIAFDLRGVSAGGEELRLAPAASVRRDGDLVTLDHGLVDEQYALETASLEQKFVIESLPARGELVLDLGVATELACAANDGGFSFSNEWGRVQYGRATVIDAAGRSLALETTSNEGSLTLRVPADFVEHASLPITIDPLITVFGVETGVSLAFSADSSYDTSGGGVLHVYNVVFSLNDWDVYAYATDRYGNVWLGSGFWTDYTSLHWTKPRVAHNRATDRFMIAGTVGQVGSRAIWGHVRSVWSNSIMAPAQLSGPEVGDKFNVDVGGDPYPVLPAYFAVVYQREYNATDHDIHARLFDTNGALYGGTIFIDNSIATIDALPSVSKSNGGAHWNIAWQRDVSGGTRSIMAARLAWQGNLDVPPFTAVADSIPSGRPSVSTALTGTMRYVIACDRDFTSDRDVGVYLFDNATLQQQINLSGYYFPTLYNDQGDASVDSDGSHFLVAFDEMLNFGEYDVLASELQWSANGLEVRENRIPIAVTAEHEAEAQVASAESSNYDQTTSDYTVVFTRGAGPGGGPTNDVYAALVTGSHGGTVFNFCDKSGVSCPCFGLGTGGCPNSYTLNGAHMSASGFAQTTQDSLSFQVTGIKPNVSCLVFQGTGLINSGFGNGLDDGVRCVGGFIRRFVAQSSSATGTLSYPPAGGLSVTVAGGVPYEGGTFYYQTWYRDTGAWCTNGMTNLSDGLVVNWTP